jgi:KaiC/GvpD/RAD55 family RecA-like ATPase
MIITEHGTKRTVLYSGIPKELKGIAQWVIWRREIRGGKPTKVPYQAAQPNARASSTDPLTWGTYQQAQAAQREADGIGFVFSETDPYVGVDFDEITDDVEKAIERLGSYTEYSVSGRGVHVVLRGKLPGGKGRRKGKFEVYSQGRFFAMTGRLFNGTPRTVEERQPQLDQVLEHFIPKKVENSVPSPFQPLGTLDDFSILQAMLTSKSGDAISRLWQGDIGGYGSASEADAALCCHLAFWTGNDAARIDSLFRRSALMREKWNREDYRIATIDGAIALTKEVYTPPRPLKLSTPHLSVVKENGAPEEQKERPPSPFVDWQRLWARETGAQWLYDDVLARGRGHAIWASHKEGKSLFMLFVAAQLATNGEPNVVIYLDYEMSEEDLLERMENMGFGPESDLSRFKYALLPSLQPLDTIAGGIQFMEMVDDVKADYPDHHLVVIIDTISRAVTGEENSADTIRAFYSHTGIKLKQRGITWARLDHGGKDSTKGQRGTSGKGDDVDVVWQLKKTDGGVKLQKTVARMSWVPDAVNFKMTEEPYLLYTETVLSWPAGTVPTAQKLEELGVPATASKQTAEKALKEVGWHKRHEVVLAAQKWRKSQLETAE